MGIYDNKFFSKIQNKIGALNKGDTFNSYIFYMLDRTRRMFKYTGLPDTMPERSLEMFLQCNGFVIVTDKYDGKPYFYIGGIGGKLDEYYRPTMAIINNPWQEFNETLKIGEECEIILNDSYYMGMIPMFNRYADLLTENLLSMKKASINMRRCATAVAHSDAQKIAFDKYIQNLESGIDSAIIDPNFLNGITLQPMANNGSTRTFTELTEYHQYLLGSWYGETGLDVAFNMKRERLVTAEADLSNNANFALVNDMSECRKDGLERINRKYGLNISIDFASEWKEIKEAKANDTGAQSTEPGKEGDD